MDTGPTSQRKLLHRKSALSLHLSSLLHHGGGKEKGIPEPVVVQLPPTPDSEITPTIVRNHSEVTSPDTDRESNNGISTANTSVAGSRSSSINSKPTGGKLTVRTPTDVDQGPQEAKKERRKSRLSMLIPSFFSSDADQQGTSVSAPATKLHKQQQRPVTANPLLSSQAPVTAANPGAQQATTSAKSTVREVTETDLARGNGTNGRPHSIIRPSTSSVNNVYYDPAANYSSSDALGRNSHNNNNSPPLSSSPRTGWFCLQSISLSFPLSYLLTNHPLTPT